MDEDRFDATKLNPKEVQSLSNEEVLDDVIPYKIEYDTPPYIEHGGKLVCPKCGGTKFFVKGSIVFTTYPPIPATDYACEKCGKVIRVETHPHYEPPKAEEIILTEDDMVIAWGDKPTGDVTSVYGVDLSLLTGAITDGSASAFTSPAAGISIVGNCGAGESK